MSETPSGLSAAELTLANRAVPCICPRQHEADPPIGITVSIDLSRPAPRERVRCSDCSRCWTRITA